MKFMKLGSKPDSFQTDGDNIRYVATDLASDVTVNVGYLKFYLHKFPLLSKSARLQKLLTDNDEIDIHDIPGGTIAFEICAKFCYGMTVTLNAYNVVAARCAAEYLEMYETIDKGNLIYKLEVFLNSSILRSWKDSIIVLQTTKSLLPWCEELQVVNHCLDSIATKASIDTSKVEWSYTYNRQKLASENENDPLWRNSVRKQQQIVPNDWWVEDLCDLQLDLYKRVITTIKTKRTITNDVIGEALRAYFIRRLPNFNNGMIQCDVPKYRALVETITWLLPVEKGTVHCRFLLMLLKGTLLLECGETEKRELVKRIGQQLEEAMVADLLIQSKNKETMSYDVDIIRNLVNEFCMNDRTDSCTDNEIKEIRSPRHISDTSKMKVAKLVDGYLAEIARDPNLSLSVFVELAEMVSSFSRLTHDVLYRAIDMFLKEHPEISKSEKKRICSLMDCKKLSPEACTHAVQNERLPLRVVVQVLFFEQVRATASSSSAGSSTPDVPDSIKADSKLPGGSLGSSRSTTTTTEEDWDANINDTSENVEKVLAGKMKSLLMSKKIFSKIWSVKDKSRENSSSDTSESATADELKSTPSRSRRQSLS